MPTTSLAFPAQASKRDSVSGSGSAAEPPAKRPKLASGQSRPASQTGKRAAASGGHAFSGSRSSSPVEATACQPAGPLSGLHLYFWRLKHAKSLAENVSRVQDNCRVIVPDPCIWYRVHSVDNADKGDETMQQAQQRGAIVQEAFSPDTNFAIVEPLTQTSQLLKELAELDRYRVQGISPTNCAVLCFTSGVCQQLKCVCSPGLTCRPPECRSKLPPGLRFVTKDFLTETFAAGELQDPAGWGWISICCSRVQMQAGAS